MKLKLCLFFFAFECDVTVLFYGRRSFQIKVIYLLFMQVSAERKADNKKGNVANMDESGHVSSKKGHKTASLSRPVKSE